MAGNWLSTPPDWSVSQGSGRNAGPGRKRFVLTAPNHRRWETVAADGHELRDLAKALHAARRCQRDEPLDAVIAGFPEHVREVPQRRCRDCTKVRLVEKHFAGSARTCRGCTQRLCGGPKSEVVPCPVCAEPRAGASLREVDGLGLACPSCASEAAAAVQRAADEVVLVSARSIAYGSSPQPATPRIVAAAPPPTVPEQLELWGAPANDRPSPRVDPKPAEDTSHDDYFRFRDQLAAAFG